MPTAGPCHLPRRLRGFDASVETSLPSRAAKSPIAALLDPRLARMKWTHLYVRRRLSHELGWALNLLRSNKLSLFLASFFSGFRAFSVDCGRMRRLPVQTRMNSRARTYMHACMHACMYACMYAIVCEYASTREHSEVPVRPLPSVSQNLLEVVSDDACTSVTEVVFHYANE